MRVAGCTANVLMLHKGEIIVANAGDSRSVLCNKGKAYELSFDHKPDNEKERARIFKAGGYISDGRVNSNLNLSRAMGDFEYKNDPKLSPEEYMITANPDITTRPCS